MLFSLLWVILQRKLDKCWNFYEAIRRSLCERHKGYMGSKTQRKQQYSYFRNNSILSGLYIAVGYIAVQARKVQNFYWAIKR